MDPRRLARAETAKLLSKDADGREDTYSVTRITEDRLEVSAPAKDLNQDPPLDGAPVTVRLALPDALYEMPGRVAEVKVDAEVRVQIRQDGDVERVQRRQNFRVEAHMLVTLSDLSLASAEAVEVVTQDVSAGGVRFMTPVHLDEGQTVRLRLDLSGSDQPVQCRVRIVRCIRVDDMMFEAGGAFVNLRAGEEDRIIKVLTARLRQHIKS